MQCFVERGDLGLVVGVISTIGGQLEAAIWMGLEVEHLRHRVWI